MGLMACIEKYCLFLPFGKYIQINHNEYNKKSTGK